MNIENKIPARIGVRNAIGHVYFGDLLYSFRRARELSQVDFAKKLKISKQELCNIEKKKKFISIDRAAAFARLLKLSEQMFVAYVLQDQLHKAGIKYEITLRKAA